MRSYKKDGLGESDSIGKTNELVPNRGTQVVIIGAGLAGLAVAQRLYSHGIKNFVILEAQDYIGGRVRTIEHSDYLLELGAQWLHGADMNPLHKWLTELELLDDFEDASLGFRGLYCSNEGSLIDQSFVKRVLSVLNDSRSILFKNLLPGMESKNAAHVFRDQFELHLQNDRELQKKRNLAYAIFEWFLRYESIENSCDTMEDVSITSYTDWTDSGDGTLLNFKDGYRSLLDWFCRQFPADQLVYLNKQVVSIELPERSSDEIPWTVDGQTSGKPILIKYLDSMERKSNDANEPTDYDGFIECDHVIVTTSLGFLKSNHEKIFKPPLPAVKRELIESLGFGTVNKIILEFESPFWSPAGGIKLLWEDTEDVEGEQSFPSWSKDIISFDTVRRQPNLLIGWIGGIGAKEMELETDDNIAQVCLRILNTFLPAQHPKPTRLIRCICSRWNSNSFVCGSYSFQSMKSLGKNLDKLHEPIYSNEGANRWISHSILGSIRSNGYPRIPRIMFAGEATAGKLYSTTHGAILSGWREADRLNESLLVARDSQPAIIGSPVGERASALSSGLLLNA